VSYKKDFRNRITDTSGYIGILAAWRPCARTKL